MLKISCFITLEMKNDGIAVHHNQAILVHDNLLTMEVAAAQVAAAYRVVFQMLQFLKIKNSWMYFSMFKIFL